MLIWSTFAPLMGRNLFLTNSSWKSNFWRIKSAGKQLDGIS
jgi:hypothetical protein